MEQTNNNGNQDTDTFIDTPNKPPATDNLNVTPAPQQPQGAELPPTVPKKRSKRLLFILIGVILLLIFTIGLYFSYTKFLDQPASSQAPVPTATAEPHSAPAPAPDPTADWETYVNTKYNYKVKFPTGFIRESFDQTDGSEDIVNFVNSAGDKETKLSIDVSTSQHLQVTYLEYKQMYEEQVQNNETEGLEGFGMRTINHKKTIDGYEAYQNTLEGQGSVLINTIFKKDDNIYLIQYLTEGVENVGLYDQILSTFEFTK